MLTVASARLLAGSREVQLVAVAASAALGEAAAEGAEQQPPAPSEALLPLQVYLLGLGPCQRARPRPCRAQLQRARLPVHQTAVHCPLLAPSAGLGLVLLRLQRQVTGLLQRPLAAAMR